jgi:hypothetical protein
MFIPLKTPEIELTEEQKERMYWQQYVNDSHRWVEYHEGYYECSFCHIHTTNMLPSVNFMCEKNPNIPPTTQKP